MLRAGQLFIQAMIATALLVASVPAMAGERFPGIEKFFGTFEGATISDVSGELSTRDLNITIEPYKDEGFTVSWTTVLRWADGTSKTKSYKISFIESGRDGVYKSAMRKNVFGHAVPLDPLKGQPYVWSSIEGDLLTVHALHITDMGGYEIQVHARKLTATGLTTRFERVLNGEKLKIITGELKKVK